MKGIIRLLKNNTERKEFLLNDDNWKIIYDLPDIATTISQMRTNTFYYPGVHKVTKYRVILDDHVSDEVSMTYLIDLLKKVKV